MKVWLMGLLKLVMVVYRAGSLLAFKTHYNKWKSWPHRLFEGKQKLETKSCFTWEEVMSGVNDGWGWLPDGIKQLWDRVPSPEHAEWMFSPAGDKVTSGRDCGAYAVLICARLNKAIKERTVLKYEGMAIFNANFLTIIFSGNAHNVCLITLRDFVGKTYFACADYSKDLNIFPSERAAIDAVVKRMSTPPHELIAASVQTLDLKCIRTY